MNVNINEARHDVARLGVGLAADALNRCTKSDLPEKPASRGQDVTLELHYCRIPLRMRNTSRRHQTLAFTLERRKTLIAALAAGALVASVTPQTDANAGGPAPSNPLLPNPPVTPKPSGSSIAQRNVQLARTVNFGNALEAPTEGAWSVTLEENYFQLVKNAGFTAVRLPVKWSAHALSAAPDTIDPTFFKRVDWAVSNATSRGLSIIVNVHHHDELLTDPAAHLERFLALWRQIAGRYKTQND